MSTQTAIQENRTTDVTLTVTAQDGSLLANQPVTVAQRNHKFLFGCTGFQLIALVNDLVPGDKRPQAEVLSDKLLDLCNFITLPFYWGRFEPVQGQPETERVLKTAQWLQEQGCLLKGHPLEHPLRLGLPGNGKDQRPAGPGRCHGHRPPPQRRLRDPGHSNRQSRYMKMDDVPPTNTSSPPPPSPLSGGPPC